MGEWVVPSGMETHWIRASGRTISLVTDCVRTSGLRLAVDTDTGSRAGVRLAVRPGCSKGADVVGCGVTGLEGGSRPGSDPLGPGLLRFPLPRGLVHFVVAGLAAWLVPVHGNILVVRVPPGLLSGYKI